MPTTGVLIFSIVLVCGQIHATRAGEKKKTTEFNVQSDRVDWQERDRIEEERMDKGLIAREQNFQSRWSLYLLSLSLTCLSLSCFILMFAFSFLYHHRRKNVRPKMQCEQWGYLLLRSGSRRGSPFPALPWLRSHCAHSCLLPSISWPSQIVCLHAPKERSREKRETDMVLRFMCCYCLLSLISAAPHPSLFIFDFCWSFCFCSLHHHSVSRLVVVFTHVSLCTKSLVLCLLPLHLLHQSSCSIAGSDHPTR